VPGGTEEYHEILKAGQPGRDRDSNPVPPECKSAALPLDQPVDVMYTMYVIEVSRF
jgi:hypothetical protein